MHIFRLSSEIHVYVSKLQKVNMRQSEISMWSLQTVSSAGRQVHGMQRRSRDKELAVASLTGTCKKLSK